MSVTEQQLAQGGTDEAEFRRIAVSGPRTRVDLSVPAGVPVARLLPTLLRLVGEGRGADGGVGHGGWVLRRDDGTAIDGARSLASAGVAPGALLFLRPTRDAEPPPLFDDVVEVIGAEGVRMGWSATETRRSAAAMTGVLLLGALLALSSSPGPLPGFLGLLVAVLLLGTGVALSRAYADVAGGTLAVVGAAPFAALGAMQLLGTPDGLLAVVRPGHLLLACAAVLTVGAVGPTLIGGGHGVHAALVLIGLLGATGALIVVVWDVDRARAVAVVAPLALALTTFLPPLALRLGRIPPPRVVTAPEDLDEPPGQLALDRVQAQVRQAQGVLTGLLTGTYLVVTVATVVLLFSGGLWGLILGGVLTVLSLLRARLFRERGQVVVPVAGVLVMLAAITIVLVAGYHGSSLELLGILLPSTVVLAATCAAVGVRSGRADRNPRLARTLDVIESLLLVGTIPLILAVWEVYTTLLNLRS